MTAPEIPAAIVETVALEMLRHNGLRMIQEAPAFWRSKARAALAALPPAAIAVLVGEAVAMPFQMTDAMNDAYVDAYANSGADNARDARAEAYKAMRAASPWAPKGKTPAAMLKDKDAAP